MKQNIIQLTNENKKLKSELETYKKTYGSHPQVDDRFLKGGLRVVQSIEERDAINCCFRKQGMVVLVVSEHLTFKQYVLTSDDPCKNEWEEVKTGGGEIPPLDYVPLSGTEEGREITGTIVSKDGYVAKLETDFQGTFTGWFEAQTVGFLDGYGTTLNVDIVNGIYSNNYFDPYTTYHYVQRAWVEDYFTTNLPTTLSAFENDTEYITINDIPEVIVPTNTSDLTNDGEDGVNPFITDADLPTPYELPIASSTVLGGVKVGSNLTITSDGTLNVEEQLPEDGSNGDVLVKDGTEAEGVKWETLPNFALDSALNTEIVNRGLADTALSNRITSLEGNKSNVVNEMLHYWDSALNKWISSGIMYNQVAKNNNTYQKTQVTNTTISSLKLSAEAEGYYWNHIDVLLNIGSNNITLNIDVLTEPVVIRRLGTGKITFSGSNVVFANDISVLEGNEGVVALIRSGTTQKFVNIG